MGNVTLDHLRSITHKKDKEMQICPIWLIDNGIDNTKLLWMPLQGHALLLQYDALASWLANGNVVFHL